MGSRGDDEDTPPSGTPVVRFAAGWYPDPQQWGHERWWDGSAWGPTRKSEERRRRRLMWLVVIAVVIVALAWNAGALDHALVNVGLNRHPCIRNGLGATFCGDEAKNYCENTAPIRRLAGSAHDDCDEILQP